MTESTTTHESARASPRPSRSFTSRLVAALRLESSLYEEVEHDPGALGQATAVVALAGIASGVGALGVLGPPAVLAGLVSTFLAWVVWTAIVWLIGVKLFHHTSDFEELLRTLGFVAAPQLLYVLALIPVAPIQGLVALLVVALTVVAFVRAVHQALDVETGRAFFVSALSVAAYLGVAGVFGVAFL
jgi:hypothetical protein